MNSGELGRAVSKGVEILKGVGKNPTFLFHSDRSSEKTMVPVGGPLFVKFLKDCLFQNSEFSSWGTNTDCGIVC